MPLKPTKAEARRSIRLLVADESPMNCQLLINALNRCRDVTVVARTTRSDEIVAEVAATSPDLALISSRLRDGSLAGFSITRELRNSRPELRTILLLDSIERGWVIDAFKSGAKGIFCREDSLRWLSRCIHAVYDGQIWASSQQLETVLEAFVRVAPSRLAEQDGKTLSKREREVAELVAEGLSNREISQQLRLSEHTIKNYLFHIFEKLGMSSRVELVLHARAEDKQIPLRSQ